MRVQAITADITTLEVDVIVNAANNAMMIGGGVDGAIHKAAGQELINYNAQHHGFGCPTGRVKVTPAFNLPAKVIYHTVGPDMREYKQELGDLLLAQCYGKCVQSALEDGHKSIAFPAISTGVFGFDKRRAAGIAAETVLLWSNDPKADDLDVTFACFAEEDAVIINEALETIDEEEHLLQWSVGDTHYDADDNEVFDLDAGDAPDGIHMVSHNHLGKVGVAKGVEVKDGQFVMEPTLRACAVARNRAGYWGTFLEMLVWNEEIEAFDAEFGS